MNRHWILALALAGCSSEAEQFVVVVDTDLAIPADIAGLEVAAFSSGGTSSDGVTFSLQETPLPISMGVLPPEDGSPLIIEARGIDIAGDDVVVRRAIVGFEPVGRMRVAMFLASSCRDAVCGAGETCTELGCASETLQMPDLGSVVDGDELAACRPGDGQCSADGTSYQRCERYGDPPVTVTCNADQRCDPDKIACVAIDGSTSARVSVTKVGGGAGYISSRSAGIDCGDVCTTQVSRGDRIVLDANPDANSRFVGWEGFCGGTGSCEFDVQQDVTVSARFESDTTSQQESLQIDVFGTGGGRVVSTPAGIDCTVGTCTARFPIGTSVTLRAEPNASSGLAAWFGDCRGLGDCTIRVDGQRFAAVNFAFDDGGAEVELLTGFGGDGLGVVRSMPAGIDCGAICSSRFPRSSSVRLQAIAEPDSRFIGWDGACVGAGECVLTMDTNRETFAIFESTLPRSVPRDINGDGYADMVFGSPGVDANGMADVGRAYIVFGPKSFATMGIQQSDRSFAGPSAGARFGAAIAVGDLDRDGNDDLVIGAPGHDGRGAVYILYGGPALVGSGPIQGAGAAVLLGEFDGDAFGAALAVEDFDLDGYEDLVVGAPGSGGATIGSIYVYSGAQGFTSNAYVAHVFGDGPDTDFGRTVASIGDIDLDGWPDLAVGEPKWSGTSGTTGRVAFFRGPGDPGKTTTSPDFTIRGSDAMDRLGVAITGLSDFNQDGIDDFAISSPVKDRVHVYYGRTNWFDGVANGDLIISEPGMFGASLSGGHDVTGDWVPDLVVGAPQHQGTWGRVYVYRGETAPRAVPERILEGRCVSNGACAAEHFGTTVDVETDLDADGFADVTVGSRYGGGTAGPPERGSVSSFRTSILTSQGPHASTTASVMVVGEDQPRAWCASLPGSHVD